MSPYQAIPSFVLCAFLLLAIYAAVVLRRDQRASMDAFMVFTVAGLTFGVFARLLFS